MAKQLSNDQMWDILRFDCGISEETLQALTSINGNNEQTYNSLLCWKTGYRDFEQAFEAEPEEMPTMDEYLSINGES